MHFFETWVCASEQPTRSKTQGPPSCGPTQSTYKRNRPLAQVSIALIATVKIAIDNQNLDPMRRQFTRKGCKTQKTTPAPSDSSSEMENTKLGEYNHNAPAISDAGKYNIPVTKL